MNRRIRRYREAEDFLRQAVTILEEVAGPASPRLAPPLSLLGRVYAEQGKCEAAGMLFQRSLLIAERSLGREHPQYAVTLSCLAGVRQAEKRWGEAELFYQEALSITERVYGPRHPRVAEVLIGYRSLLQAMKRKAEARRIAERIRNIGTLAPNSDERYTVDVLALKRK